MDMVGRRLVACSDFDCWACPGFIEDACNEIVRGVKATWSKMKNTAVKAAKDAGQALLTPIRALISTLETQMEVLVGQLKMFFKDAIEILLGDLEEVAITVADAVKGAMLGLLETCFDIPGSCLIGPPEGCEDGTSPGWESTIMTLSVSHFHSCCA